VSKMKTQVGALHGPGRGVPGRGEAGFGQHYPVCVPLKNARRSAPSNAIPLLNGPLFDQEAKSKGPGGGRRDGDGFEILGPVGIGKNKGRYLMRLTRSKKTLDGRR
jgi:hypothetical protein